ncbi:CD276 antigen-like isoform X2 [Carcharodon carcharias]|uniref:CD276 antigen-like isoform X2 n=1 Tax=Carcharodon carcharias TaxID=13397 RepID=UPI001B7DC45F|nr:CD276 antigen-like isoform X2 [Carcharodon carcharias]
MNILHQSRHKLLALLSLFYSAGGGTPRVPTLARLGQEVTLGCSFPPAPLPGLIIEWSLRRGPTETRVAYSYHHGAAHLSGLHPQFRNRTLVEPEGLPDGRAPLRLKGVSPRDEGHYLCYVRSARGKHQEGQELQLAAPYSRPEVFCEADVPLRVKMSCQSLGGYPRARLRWLWANGSRFGGEEEEEEEEEEKRLWAEAVENGTYELRSTLEVPAGVEGKLRCEVVNPRTGERAASGQSCGVPGSTAPGRRVYNSSVCNECRRRTDSPHKPRARFAILGCVAIFLLLLSLLACTQSRPPGEPLASHWKLPERRPCSSGQRLQP